MIPHNATSSTIDDPGQKSKILIIFPSPEERGPIMDALNRVMDLLGTDSLARAIYALASDWLEANDDKTAIPPLQDKIHFLEQIYNVKLTAHSKA